MRHAIFLAALAVVPLSVPAQQVIVPAGTATTEGNTSNAFPWARRNSTPGLQIQFIYDSSNFISQGMVGPSLITSIRWRANGSTTATWTGGTYAQALMEMSTSPNDWSTPSTTFAQNHGVDRTVVLNGPVTVLPQATGAGIPGPWYVDTPLTTQFLYDPSAGDLCIDVSFTSASFSGGTTSSHDIQSTGSMASRIYASTTYGSPTGTVNTNHGAVIEVNFVPAAGAATVNRYGMGCYDQAVSFYETFAPGTFDLAGGPGVTNSMLLQPLGNGGYVALPGSNTFFTPVAPNLGLTDDSVSPAQALPFSFPYTGGTTTNLYVSSNGFVWMQASTVNGCCNGNVGLLLSQGARFSPFWQDLNPSAGGSVHVDVDAPNGVAYVTWLNVPEFSNNGSNTVQVAFYSDGRVEYRWQACATLTHTALVGWSPGGGARDPGPIDISTAIPFLTLPESNSLVLGAIGRPVLGGTFRLSTTFVPLGSPLGVHLLSFGQFNPGIDLTGAGMPGCFQYAGTEVSLAFVPSGTTGTQLITMPGNPALSGTHFFSQSLVFAQGFNSLGLVSSNGLDLGAGIQ